MDLAVTEGMQEGTFPHFGGQGSNSASALKRQCMQRSAGLASFLRPNERCDLVKKSKNINLSIEALSPSAQLTPNRPNPANGDHIGGFVLQGHEALNMFSDIGCKSDCFIDCITGAPKHEALGMFYDYSETDLFFCLIYNRCVVSARFLF